MNKPIVSVIIPVFNFEEYIEETINSVLKQSYKNFEIIVIDDSSTDNTFKIVQSLSKKFSSIKCFKIDHSGRPSVPRNYGIGKAKGEFVAFLDGDDLWVPNKLEIQVQFMSNNPELIFVYSASVTKGVSIFSSQFEVLPLINKAAKTRYDLIKKGNTITCSSILVRKRFLDQVNGFDEDPNLKIEDYDLWLRLSEIGPFQIIPKLQVYYRIHPSQFSSDYKIKQERLQYLAKKRNLELPPYKFYRNKGFIYLAIRNFVHVLTFLWLKIIGNFKS